jgi:HEAT repeat protein
VAPKRKTLEALLVQLIGLRERPVDDESCEILCKALRGRSSHGAAKAAGIAGEIGADAVVPDMLAAFERFMTNPVRSDPGCAAKEAIADTLQQMGVAAADVYRRGIAHRQMEPVWGGRVDTAPRLRGVCGLALARIRDESTLSELAVLLADGEALARRMAAQALAYNGDTAAVPLLRYKAMVGDEDGEVMTESLRALLDLAPAESLPFVASFLDEGNGMIAEAAALALGGARIEGAFEVLRDWWTRVGEPSLKSSAALALAMLRREASIEFLLDVVSENSVLDARHALKALAIYRHDDRLRERVEAAAQQRKDTALRSPLEKWFDA